jgi:hypothetical protein
VVEDGFGGRDSYTSDAKTGRRYNCNEATKQPAKPNDFLGDFF